MKMTINITITAMIMIPNAMTNVMPIDIPSTKLDAVPITIMTFKCMVTAHEYGI